MGLEVLFESLSFIVQPLFEHLLYTGLSTCWVVAATVGEGTHMDGTTFWPQTRTMADTQEDGKLGGEEGPPETTWVGTRWAVSQQEAVCIVSGEALGR